MNCSVYQSIKCLFFPFTCVCVCVYVYIVQAKIIENTDLQCICFQIKKDFKDKDISWIHRVKTRKGRNETSKIIRPLVVDSQKCPLKTLELLMVESFILIPGLLDGRTSVSHLGIIMKIFIVLQECEVNNNIVLQVMTP